MREGRAGGESGSRRWAPSPMTRRVYNLGIGLHFQPIGPTVFIRGPVQDPPPPFPPPSGHVIPIMIRLVKGALNTEQLKRN